MVSAETPLGIQHFLLDALPQSFALLVVVNHPSVDLPDCLRAEADLEQLGRTLIAGGWAKDRVVLLTQSPGNGNGAKPTTKDNTLAALKALADKCKNKDTLLVDLAGHQVNFAGIGPKGN